MAPSSITAWATCARWRRRSSTWRRKPRVQVTSDPACVAAADRVVFPGQGAMPDCMRELDARGLRPSVLEAARGQALSRHLHRPADAVRAQRGGRRRRAWHRPPAPCGVFRGAAMVDPDGARLKVPHMGWNEVEQARPHALWEGIAETIAFLFRTQLLRRTRSKRE